MNNTYASTDYMTRIHLMTNRNKCLSVFVQAYCYWRTTKHEDTLLSMHGIPNSLINGSS